MEYNYFYVFYGQGVFGFMGVYVNNLVAALVPVLLEPFPPRGVKNTGVFVLKILACILVMNLLCALSWIVFVDKFMSQVCGGTLLLLYLIFMSKSRLAAKIAYGVSYFSVISIVLVICFSTLDITHTLGMEGFQTVASCLITVMLIGCVMFLKIFSLDKPEEVTAVSICATGIAGTACTVFWLITNFFTVDAVASLMVGIMLLVLLLAAYYSSYAISRAVSENNRRRADELLRSADENMLRLAETNMEALRKARHELRNQFTYMKLLLEQKEYDKLDAYFAEYSEKLLPSLSFVDCGNRVVSAVMNVELAKAVKEGIIVNYSLAVPHETAFSDRDICSLLFNLLNNAIEYLCRSNVECKEIEFSLRMNEKTLVVSCENAIADEDAENALLLRTSKADTTAHGYGSKVVRSIVESYNGSLNYEIKDGKFSVGAMLAEPETSGGGVDINGYYKNCDMRRRRKHNRYYAQRGQDRVRTARGDRRNRSVFFGRAALARNEIARIRSDLSRY